MKFRVSLKQLFLVGLLASPVWLVVLMAWQGRSWAQGVLLVQILAVVFLFLMSLLVFFSDRLALLLFRRRMARGVTRKSSAGMTGKPASEPMPQVADVYANTLQQTSDSMGDLKSDDPQV